MQCYIKNRLHSCYSILDWEAVSKARRKGHLPRLLYLNFQSWLMIRRQMFRGVISKFLVVDYVMHLSPGHCQASCSHGIKTGQSCSWLSSHLGLQVEFPILWEEKKTYCYLWQNWVSLPIVDSVPMISQLVSFIHSSACRQVWASDCRSTDSGSGGKPCPPQWLGEGPMGAGAKSSPPDRTFTVGSTDLGMKNKAVGNCLTQGRLKFGP